MEGSNLDEEIVTFIVHYKKKLENEKLDRDELIRALEKLGKVRMSPDYLKHTGVGKTIKPYLAWPERVGDLAKALEAAWRKCYTESAKKSKPAERSRNSDGETGHKRHRSKESVSLPTNNKKVKVEVKVSKDATSRVCADNGEELFAMPSLIKRHNDTKPSKRGSEQSVNGAKLSEKKATSSSNKPDKSGTSSKDNRCSASKSSDLGRSSKSIDPVHLKSVYPIGGSSHSADAKTVKPPSEKMKNASSSSSRSKDTPTKKRTKKLAKAATEEGFDASIASFDECLGIPDYTRTSAKKKKVTPAAVPQPKMSNHNPSTSSSMSSEKASKTQTNPVAKPERSSPPLVQSKSAIQDTSVTSTLPEIQPNYKPLRFSMPDVGGCRPKKMNSEVSDGSFLSSRHNRTQVFSGRRTGLTEVPRLFDIAIKTLQENISDLTFTGGIPYDILQPVFEKCAAMQLYSIEYFNPYLIDDTVALWEKHCEREFKGKKREEHETWRDLYLRLMDEREAKLKRITANISAAVAKTLPVRKTKLAFVDCAVKPPRDIARQQAKLGIVSEHPRNVVTKSTSSLKHQLVKPPPGADCISAPAVPDPGTSASGNFHQKPAVKKVAPLMQKTLKFMKNRFRR